MNLYTVLNGQTLNKTIESLIEKYFTQYSTDFDISGRNMNIKLSSDTFTTIIISLVDDSPSFEIQPFDNSFDHLPISGYDDYLSYQDFIISFESLLQEYKSKIF